MNGRRKMSVKGWSQFVSNPEEILHLRCSEQYLFLFELMTFSSQGASFLNKNCTKYFLFCPLKYYSTKTEYLSNPDSLKHQKKVKTNYGHLKKRVNERETVKSEEAAETELKLKRDECKLKEGKHKVNANSG